MVHKNDIVLSIGGDNYCYADVNKYIMPHMMISRGSQDSIMGCSINPVVLSNPEIVNDVRQYQLITARESITYNALKKVNPNTILVADPAFGLKTGILQKFHLSLSIKHWRINLSPMVQKEEKDFRNYNEKL